MAEKKIESPSKSFEGWKFGKWFTGNWSTLKQLLKVGLPLLISMQLFDPLWANFLGTIVGKFIIDSGEYWLKEYK